MKLSRSLFEFCISRNSGEREGRKEAAGSFDVIGSGGWEEEGCVCLYGFSLSVFFFFPPVCLPVCLISRVKGRL